jgi:hypothetical protein
MISLYFSKRYLTSGGEAAAEGIKFHDQSLFSKRYLTSGGEAAAEGSSFMISLYFQNGTSHPAAKPQRRGQVS